MLSLHESWHSFALILEIASVNNINLEIGNFASMIINISEFKSLFVMMLSNIIKFKRLIRNWMNVRKSVWALWILFLSESINCLNLQSNKTCDELIEFGNKECLCLENIFDKNCIETIEFLLGFLSCIWRGVSLLQWHQRYFDFLWLLLILPSCKSSNKQRWVKFILTLNKRLNDLGRPIDCLQALIELLTHNLFIFLS